MVRAQLRPANSSPNSMKTLVLVLFVLAGCGGDQPSDQCLHVWSLDKDLQALPARTVNDAIRKDAIHQHALWCNQSPSGEWL